MVWAYNIETGELELKEVLTVYVKENKEILHLETSIGNIDTTTNHPFYVIGEGWVAAGDLEVGDEVYTLDGSVSVITGFQLELFATPVTVYNLEVEGFHTYSVGGFGVLVHNVYPKWVTEDGSAGKVVSYAEQYLQNPNSPLNENEVYELIDLADLYDVQYYANDNDLNGFHPNTDWDGISHFHLGDKRIHIPFSADLIDTVKALLNK